MHAPIGIAGGPRIGCRSRMSAHELVPRFSAAFSGRRGRSGTATGLILTSSFSDKKLPVNRPDILRRPAECCGHWLNIQCLAQGADMQMSRNSRSQPASPQLWKARSENTWQALYRSKAYMYELIDDHCKVTEGTGCGKGRIPGPWTRQQAGSLWFLWALGCLAPRVPSGAR